MVYQKSVFSALKKMLNSILPIGENIQICLWIFFRKVPKALGGRIRKN
uniref:Uncharacterized protein n=1 Tax=Siphoviridae sp. ctTnV63 TaxID=2825523 RepID=A0A8S5NWE1_9CAUD|nr:MAG TPA: hypothetical protein [Siphoviridae sp. ctTnV63]